VWLITPKRDSLLFLFRRFETNSRFLAVLISRKNFFSKKKKKRKEEKRKLSKKKKGLPMSIVPSRALNLN